MKCPKCRFENREGAKFCKECGAKLELAFPKRDLHLRSLDESVVLKPTKTIS